MENLLENLNKEQTAAVMHRDGPILIVAGAGTGKTTVITQRIAYLIEQGLARPDEILALTFTDKAAGEMEERVDRLLPMGYTDLWISTFHSFGERLLKDHGLDIGLPDDFKLLNEFEGWALIKKNLDKFALDYYRPLGNPTKFIHALVKHFSRAKDEDVSPSDYLKYAEELKQNLDGMLSGSKKSEVTRLHQGYDGQGSKKKNPKSEILNPKQIPNSNVQNSKHDSLEHLNLKISDLFRVSNLEFRASKEVSGTNQLIAAQEVIRINEVANAYHVYQQLLLDSSALDFGDLINYALKLLRERPAILAKYRQRFKYILLDEFQDTNWAQYELVKLLASPRNNLAVVGDDDQSIYKFRGASVANILQFKKDFPDTKEVALIKNYRSKQNILDLAYGFIQLNNPNRLEFQMRNENKINKKNKNNKELDNHSALSKRLKAEIKGEGEIAVLTGTDLSDEVRLVVEKIADLKTKDPEASFNDFAILVRANASAAEFCRALDLAGLPYIFYAARGLYAKPAIMDIVAYLKLLDDYHESAAFYRVLNLPVFGFTHNELVSFNFLAGKKAWSLYEVLRNAPALQIAPQTVEKTRKVLALLDKHAALAREKSAVEVAIAFLEDSGYIKSISAQKESEGREVFALVNQFMKRVRDFENASDDRSVNAFLAELALEIDSGEEGSLAPDLDAGPEAIRVMTVHAAKGLEFKYAFIVNLVDKRFPTIERRDAIEVPDALIKEALPEGDIHLEEERRLFYVAVTRAREGVFFSWAPDYGGARKKKPSRFLMEAGLINQSSEDKKTPRISNQFLNPNDLISSNSKLDHSKFIQNSKFKIQNLVNKTSDLKLPDYFSYTQLAAFTNCPNQYRFAHVLKVPRRGKFNLSFGQTMHLALERLFKLAEGKRQSGQTDLFGNSSKTAPAAGQAAGQARISKNEIREIFEHSWQDDWYESKKQKEEYREKGLSALLAFYEKHKDNWPVTLGLEQGIRFRLNGSSIYGKVDRIDDLKEKGIRIVDYKTGRPKDPGTMSLEDKEQLLIYQMGALEIFRRPIASLVFYYLDDQSMVEFTGGEKDIEAMRGKVVAKIAEIGAAFKSNDFPPQPGPLCRFCDFFHICEYRKNS